MGVIAILIVIAPFKLFGQDSTHLRKGDEYYKLFYDYFGDNSDSVIHYLNLAHDEYKKGEHWEQYISTLNGYCSFYAMNNEYADSEKYANLALSESQKYFDETDLVYSVSLSNHSFFLMRTGDFTQAINQFKNGLEIERLYSTDSTYVGASLKNIGDAYNEIGDLDEALKYYTEAIAYNEVNNVFKGSSLSRIYRRQGVAYYRKNELELSLNSFQKSLNLLSNDRDKLNYLNYTAQIDIYNDLAKIYLKRDNRDSLFYYVNKSLELCTGAYENKKDDNFILLGSYYIKNGEYDKAIKNLLTAKESNAIRYSNYKKHITFSQIDKLLASAYAKKGDFLTSIALNIAAINNLKSDVKSNESSDLPTIEGVTAPLEALEAYKQIGDAYINLYNKTNDFNHLKTAFLSYQNATTLITEIRNSLQEESSLLRYSEIAIPIYEASISSSLKMHKYTKEEKYLVYVFNYIEKSKAILLLESINELSAIKFSEIPDSLKQKEKDYKLHISKIKRVLYDEINVLENENTFKIEKLNRQLFSESEAYDKLIRRFEKDYPAYYKLKYDNQTVSIEKIQHKLNGTNAQLVEFFSGLDHTYVFSISEDDYTVKVIPNTEKSYSDIQNVKDFLNSPPSGQNVKNQLVIYTTAAKNVFDTYLKEVIFSNSQHLILITDGELSFLPFEALITQTPKSEDVSFSLENLSYLIEDYLVSYSYSSTLFMNSFKSKHTKDQNNFLGVAPSFGEFNGKNQTRICNENALYSLQCSENEVQQIQNKIGGKILVGKEATLVNTIDKISNSRIIHLATHACLDDKNPEFNKIYLADDYLSNNDLYNLKLNSELAVLSACETGSGRLAKGEGVMSLARGFIHAGCPSIVMSLWSIDDCATSKIMIDFYDEIYDEKPKTEALRNAKLKYIKEAKRANQHPYYWAAFVQIGNYNPIKISSTKIYLYYLLGALGLICLIFFLKNKFKNS